MSDVSDPRDIPPAPHRLVIVLCAAGIVALLAAALLLWARDGAAVFFEMMVAGIMSCF